MEGQVLSIEQMQYLQKLGIDTSKAKMAYYAIYETEPNWYNELRIRDEVFDKYYPSIPTFTLQDMLEMMPPRLYSFPFEDKERYVIHDMVMNRLTGEWLIGYRHGLIKGELLVSFQDDLLTCAYETLCWLAENNYIGGKNENKIAKTTSQKGTKIRQI